MNLSEALTRLKHLKSKVSQVRGYINQSISYYEGDTPEFDYKEELEKYKVLTKDIRHLKTRIQMTNLKTKTQFEGVTRSLSELILLNADLRSDLSLVTNLHNEEFGSMSRYDRMHVRTKEDVIKVYAQGYNKKELRGKIELLESKREKLEGVLTTVNSKTQIVEL